MLAFYEYYIWDSGSIHVPFDQNAVVLITAAHSTSVSVTPTNAASIATTSAFDRAAQVTTPFSQ